MPTEGTEFRVLYSKGSRNSQHARGYLELRRVRGAVTRTVGYETSAPIEDGVGETGVYVGSFRATYLARRSQQRECVELKGDVRFRLRTY